MLFPSFLAFALVLSSNLMPSYATESDINCLKSFMSSVEDPFGYLKSSWSYSNLTEGFLCKFTGVECWHSYENRVLNLRLSGMGLKGKFPLGLANCSSLVGLDLSNNNFSGSIPYDIGQMLPFATSIDLSNNDFSGEIPANMANCSYLNELKMDNNRLTGTIPQNLGYLSRLKVFSVANNLLSGEVPVFLNNAFLDASSYAGNPDLCGYPLDPCPNKPRKRRLPIPFISGFAVGYVLCFLAVFVASMLYCMPKMPRRKKVPAKRVTKTRRKEKEAIDE